MAKKVLLHIERCPQCGFRFRGRAESYQHLSPLARRLQWAGYVAIFPMLIGVAAFIALTRDEQGMIDFAGRDNLIMLVIFQPSLMFFIASMLMRRHQTYRCPQCSWQKTLRSAKDLPAPEREKD